PRRGIAEMLGQMQHAISLPQPHVQRQAGLEPMLEHHLEAEEIDVEFPRLGLVKAAQDRDRRLHQRPRNNPPSTPRTMALPARVPMERATDLVKASITESDRDERLRLLLDDRRRGASSSSSRRDRDEPGEYRRPRECSSSPRSRSKR